MVVWVCAFWGSTQLVHISLYFIDSHPVNLAIISGGDGSASTGVCVCVCVCVCMLLIECGVSLCIHRPCRHSS